MKNLITLFWLFACIFSFAQDDKKDNPLPLEAARKVPLNLTQGTWISVDVSPDGKTIAFDLLGDLYTMPLSGGKATAVTTGMAFDSHPKFNPDGKSLVFISDRSGADNIWTISLSSKKTTQITKDENQNYQSAEWTPDGEFIIGSRGRRNLKLWMFHKDGGAGVQLVKEPESLKMVEPAFGKDEKLIWFSQRSRAWNYNAQLPQYQIGVYNREKGEIETRVFRHGSSFAPTLSPDGKWLVYGTRYNTETGLIRRDLATGEEEWLAYPVQRDEQESIAPMGVLPAMSFTPDSQYLITFYGGKINKISIEDKTATEIPFQVETTFEMGPEVKFDYPISDEPEKNAVQIRNPVLSADGKKLAFTALNRLYVMDYPSGTPKRLTNDDYTEAEPTWGPGNELVYVTWEGNGGNMYKIGADGTGKTKLTSNNGYYINPAWDQKSNRIVFVRGSARAYKDAIGPFARGAQDKLAWISSQGGEITDIDFAYGRSIPHFSNIDDRIYLFHGKKGLISIRYDGSDEKEHLKVKGITTFGSVLEENCILEPSATEPAQKPSSAEIIKISPDGSKVLAQVNRQVYWITMPKMVGKVTEISVNNPSSAIFPSGEATFLGGEFPSWNPNSNTLHFSLGKAFFTYNINAAKQREEEIKKFKEEQKNSKKKKKKNDKDKGPDEYKATEISIKVPFKRDIPEGSILLKNARVITMKGDEILEKGDILVENNRIKQIGASGSIQAEGVEEMDLSGKTIIPGLVDTHAHMWPNWGLHKNTIWIYAANLAYGVTTTRDPQTATTDVLTYGDMVEAGMMPGPRVYSTGPGVGFWAYKIKDQEHANKVLKQYSEYYDTKTIKMYLVGNRQHRQMIIKAAKEQKLMPTTEGGLDFRLNMTQLIDGYPGHEHSIPIYPLYDDLIKTVASSGMAYTPTLLVSYGGPWAENYYYATEDLVNDEKINYFTPKAELDLKSRRRSSWFLPEEHVFSRHAEFVNDLVKAGGLAGVGSHGQLQGLGYHWELWSIASGGISEHNALKVATILGAESIGLSKDLGSLEAGKLADLLILEGNPLENIRNTNTIEYVMKNGRLYDASTLDQEYPVKKAAPVLFTPDRLPEGLPGMK